jgi:hypothetical protein
LVSSSSLISYILTLVCVKAIAFACVHGGDTFGVILQFHEKILLVMLIGVTSQNVSFRQELY